MIIAYCPDERERRRLGLVELNLPIRPVQSWSAFEQAAQEDGIGLVVVVSDLAAWDRFEGLRRLRVLTPGVPMTLVTDSAPANTTQLAQIDVDHVLWLDQIHRLPECVTQVRVESLRVRLVRGLQAHDGLTPKESDLLAALFLASPPPNTLDGWASAAYCSSSTIKYHLRKRLARVGVTVRAAVNLNLLLAALESSPLQASWSALATSVGVDQRRLKATAEVWGIETKLGPKGADPARLIAHVMRRVSLE